MNADERGQIEIVPGGERRAGIVCADVLCADVLAGLATMADGSVDCIVTSPPYWGLRQYAGVEPSEWPEVSYQPMTGVPAITVPAERSCYGLEATIEAYVAHTVLVGRELRRVLVEHGTLWWDLGDAYSSGGRDSYDPSHELHGECAVPTGRPGAQAGLKPLDLCLIPQRVALAFQADGWIVRSEVVWAKKSPMPQSVRGWSWVRCRVRTARKTSLLHEDPKLPRLRHSGETVFGATQWEPCPGCEKCRDTGGWVLRKGSWRPTTAHEAVFRLDKAGEPLMLLAKSPDYFADGEAVREGAQQEGRVRDDGVGGAAHAERQQHSAGGVIGVTAGRNPRTVWTLGPEPNSETICGNCGETYNKTSLKGLLVVRVDGAKKRQCACGSTNLIGHYAAFPSELPTRCILASTSEGGYCSACGKPWAPRVESATSFESGSGKSGRDPSGKRPEGFQGGGEVRDVRRGPVVRSTVLGYRPTCDCQAEPRPGIVLDPFAGSGTTLLAAVQLGRRAVGIELSEDYHRIATNRLTGLLVKLGQGRTVEPVQMTLF